MDRLTEMNESKTGYFYPQCFENGGGVGSSNKCDSCDFAGRTCDKLGTYEDLEERLQAVYGSCDGLLEKVIGHLEQHEGVDLPGPVFRARLLTDGEVDRWEEFKDLEEQGKLLKLPAEIGDKVFFMFMDCPKDYKEEYCRDHEGSCENCHHRVPEIVSRDFQMSDIPNMDKIYVTREEAEAALKDWKEVRKNETN